MAPRTLVEKLKYLIANKGNYPFKKRGYRKSTYRKSTYRRSTYRRKTPYKKRVTTCKKLVRKVLPYKSKGIVLIPSQKGRPPMSNLLTPKAGWIIGYNSDTERIASFPKSRIMNFVSWFRKNTANAKIGSMMFTAGSDELFNEVRGVLDSVAKSTPLPQPTAASKRFHSDLTAANEQMIAI